MTNDPSSNFMCLVVSIFFTKLSRSLDFHKVKKASKERFFVLFLFVSFFFCFFSFFFINVA